MHQLALSPTISALAIPFIIATGGCSLSFDTAESAELFVHVDVARDVRTTNIAASSTNLVTDTKLQLASSYKRLKCGMDHTEKTTAAAAHQEALAFLTLLGHVSTPWAAFSDDGLVMLEWREHQNGLALLFHGDGEVTVSETNELSTYLTAPRTLRVEDHTAEEVQRAIRSLAI